MDQKWIHMLVILVFYQKIPSGAGVEKVVKEGANVDINCEPREKGSLVVWFRVLDTSGMEFIGSYTPTGLKKPSSGIPSSTFSDSKVAQHILTLTAFSRAKDVGIYSCASLIKGIELKFGEITRLVGEKAAVAPATTTTTSTEQKTQCTTAAPCVCNTNNRQEEPTPDMFCAPIILFPLVGGCGLLLLLLFITTIYCHKIRTRRCPHHYKRQPRTMPAGKQMNNRPV